MRISCGRARIEAHQSSAGQPLERSPSLFRHLRGEGSSVREAELRDRDEKRVPRADPPVRALQSRALERSYLFAAVEQQDGHHTSLRSMSERRRQRVHAAPARLG